MKRANNEDILKAIVPEFVKTTNEILEVYEKFPSALTLKDEFSMVLMLINQQFMFDAFPSAPLLVDHQRFISFAILTRSILDIIIQLTWLLSLDDAKKQKAIKCFLEFEGVYLNAKGKHQYEWQYLIDENYSLRGTAIAVGIDREILSLPVSKIQSVKDDLVTEVNGMEIKLTVFDYLSKITHWNPRLLTELVGVNKEKHVGYTNEYLRMCIIALPTFISCAVIFAEIFCGHLFEDKDNQLEKLQNIKADFEQSFADLLNNSLIDSAIAS